MIEKYFILDGVRRAGCLRGVIDASDQRESRRKQSWMSAPAYLLTGFPSFAAKKMCEELLRAGDGAEVFAVVHQKLAKDAEVALAELPKRIVTS